jgi:hypothetical protein
MVEGRVCGVPDVAIAVRSRETSARDKQWSGTTSRCRKRPNTPARGIVTCASGLASQLMSNSLPSGSFIATP